MYLYCIDLINAILLILSWDSRNFEYSCIKCHFQVKTYFKIHNVIIIPSNSRQYSCASSYFISETNFLKADCKICEIMLCQYRILKHRVVRYYWYIWLKKTTKTQDSRCLNLYEKLPPPKSDRNITHITVTRPPLWSSGQSSWLQIQRSGFDSRGYQGKVVVLERDPLSLASTTEELFERKSSGSGLESREYDRRDPSSWPRGTLYPQRLPLISPTSGGISVGIVRLRIEATKFVCYNCNNVARWMEG
jgi:hypothetical protein